MNIMQYREKNNLGGGMKATSFVRFTNAWSKFYILTVCDKLF